MKIIIDIEETKLIENKEPKMIEGYLRYHLKMLKINNIEIIKEYKK